jgi:hypothetical protein
MWAVEKAVCMAYTLARLAPYANGPVLGDIHSLLASRDC